MDLVSVPDGMWGQHGARGSARHGDFVLVHAVSFAPLLVVELDARSHETASARERDACKDAALASAGVPILRVKAAARYDGLRVSVAGAMRSGTAPPKRR